MNLSIIPVSEVPVELQQEMRNWRNDESVCRNMHNDHTVSIEEHNNWLQSLPTSKVQKVWMVFSDQKPIAVINLHEISPKNKRTDWGFYLDPKLGWPGIGAKVLYMFLRKIFEEWGFEKVNSVVLSNNMTALKLHKKFGFVQEGIRREHILRDGKKLDCHLLGLRKEEWLPICEKYNRLLDS